MPRINDANMVMISAAIKYPPDISMILATIIGPNPVIVATPTSVPTVAQAIAGESEDNAPALNAEISRAGESRVSTRIELITMADKIPQKPANRGVLPMTSKKTTIPNGSSRWPFDIITVLNRGH